MELGTMSQTRPHVPTGAELRESFMRQPTAFCPGCGHGIFLNAFLRAAVAAELDFERTVFVSGIGCGAWVPSPHFRADTLHVTHGRAIAYATGVKLARPDLEVIVISGDGDIANIGGNHLIHAARRDMPIKVFCLNNWLFGMTGGQVSATTPHDAHTITTPAGNPESGFNLVNLVRGAGARYVARWPVAHPVHLQRGIVRALRQTGFAFVEVMSTCPTHFGRANSDLWKGEQESDAQTIPWQMLQWQERSTIERDKADHLDRAHLAGKITIGEWIAGETDE
jgi:2-oxoglutarate/2-oxoacid ferredoxin oxidoreductase subunit beta